ADSFQELLLFSGALGVEPRAPGFVLAKPLARVGAVLDLFEHLAHSLAGLLGDDLGTASVIAVLGGIADRVTHVVEAATINEINDQLELVQALEIGDLRLVASLDQGFKSRFDEGADTAAKDG